MTKHRRDQKKAAWKKKNDKNTAWMKETKSPQHLRVWAASPPFAKVYVTPFVAHSGARYLDHDSPLVALGQAMAGIHVACQAHKDEIEALIGRKAS